jgi:hypothetical protein
VSDVRPDRHALLDLDALLGELAVLRDDGDAARFDQDSATAGFSAARHGAAGLRLA